MAAERQARGALARLTDEVEETAIAVILAVMVAITFANVVLRYGFNTGIIWGLEATSYLFAWLVLLGASYAVKTTAHLGVDAFIGAVARPARRALAFAAVAVCLAYAFLMLKAAYDYWANFANLPRTTGRWLPTGFEEMGPTSYRAWYTANDIPMPGVLAFLGDAMNGGQAYDKLPRFIPYAILPLGGALLLWRFVQVGLRVVHGRVDMLIVSHDPVDDEVGSHG